jgi:hypothetical protein
MSAKTNELLRVVNIWNSLIVELCFLADQQHKKISFAFPIKSYQQKKKISGFKFQLLIR